MNLEPVPDRVSLETKVARLQENCENSKPFVGLGVSMLLGSVSDMMDNLLQQVIRQQDVNFELRQLNTTLTDERDHLQRRLTDVESKAWHEGFNKGYDQAGVDDL